MDDSTFIVISKIATGFIEIPNKIAEIEACETLSELDAIVIQETTGVI